MGKSYSQEGIAGTKVYPQHKQALRCCPEDVLLPCQNFPSTILKSENTPSPSVSFSDMIFPTHAENKRHQLLCHKIYRLHLDYCRKLLTVFSSVTFQSTSHTAANPIILLPCLKSFTLLGWSVNHLTGCALPCKTNSYLSINHISSHPCIQNWHSPPHWTSVSKLFTAQPSLVSWSSFILLCLPKAVFSLPLY